MAANKPTYPACGCEKRCNKRKCNRGSRALAVSPETLESPNIQVARGLSNRPEARRRMWRILAAARATPVLTDLCKRAGVSRTLVRYWLTLSKKGFKGDVFDLPLSDDDDRTERFHVLFEDASESAWDAVETRAYSLATGTEREILHHQGRVSYKYDPILLALGLTGEQAYLIDPKTGDPVPETVPLLDPEMVRWLLARRRSEQYGNKMKVEHEHKGGVLVVGARKSSQQLEADYKQIRHDAIEDVEFEEVEEGSEAEQ